MSLSLRDTKFLIRWGRGENSPSSSFNGLLTSFIVRFTSVRGLIIFIPTPFGDEDLTPENNRSLLDRRLDPLVRTQVPQTVDGLSEWM